MLAASFKKTKIIATLGPATGTAEKIAELIKAGANGIRLNLSHGTHEEHKHWIKLIRQASAELSKPVSIIADLQGPKIRVGALPLDGVPMVRSRTVCFQYAANYEEAGIIPIQHDFSGNVQVGQRMFLRDGLISVKITAIKKGVVETKVETPGILLTNQGINLPDADFGGNILTDKDIADIKFAVEQDADYLALSFVQTADDIINLKKRLHRLDSDMAVISKIETKAAIDDLEGIIAASDAVMVARGDLAIETSNEAVPVLQRTIIDLARQYRRPVIVATQMLESMLHSTQPSRAEVSDVSWAVIYGTDAVMLSGETAMGEYPIETVTMMKRIIRHTEEQAPRSGAINDFGDTSHVNAISATAVILARQTAAKVIVAGTTSGQTARNLSSFRPSTPIIILTNNPRVYQQLAIVWGGKAFLVSMHDFDSVGDVAIETLVGAGNIRTGDTIVVASGHQPGVVGGTDTIQVKIVP
jgi:pyruvate kinase